MNWTQVSCLDCWHRNNPDREPFRIHWPPGEEPPTPEHCSWCNNPTDSGIYVRADPRTVPFPQPEDDDE